MRFVPYVSTLLLAAMLSLAAHAGTSATPIRDDYELTVEVCRIALLGWDLYQGGEWDGDYNGGHYTNPVEQTRVKDFWSNGIWAIVDRDNNGHHETIFLIEEGRLTYLGSLGEGQVFIDVAGDHEEALGQPLKQVLERH